MVHQYSRFATRLLVWAGVSLALSTLPAAYPPLLYAQTAETGQISGRVSDKIRMIHLISVRW
jgi:hypothetical protein